MWRYLVGALAALLLVAAGVVLSRGRAAPEALLPGAPQAPAAGQPVAPAAALPASAPKATERTREEARFGRYDKDRDSSITREEYLASRHKAYAKLDTNHDGMLSFDEWSAKTIERFATADKNKSGALNAAEFATTAVQRPAQSARAGCAKTPARKDDG